MADMPPSEEAVAAALPLHFVTEADFGAWKDAQSAAVRAWLGANGFQPERGRSILLPETAGGSGGALVGLGKQAPADAAGWFWLGAALADRLAFASYQLARPQAVATLPFTLGWAYGCYRYQRYTTPRATQPRRPHLQTPPGVDERYVAAATTATAWVRDLVNTPANDLGPDELEQEARALTSRHGGSIQVVRDEALRREFPLIAAVGQGSVRAPRLLDLRFPSPGAPRVTLVGKGV
jgi:leucyl aminopeptidase